MIAWEPMPSREWKNKYDQLSVKCQGWVGSEVRQARWCAWRWFDIVGAETEVSRESLGLLTPPLLSSGPVHLSPPPYVTVTASYSLIHLPDIDWKNLPTMCHDLSYDWGVIRCSSSSQRTDCRDTYPPSCLRPHENCTLSSIIWIRLFFCKNKTKKPTSLLK